MVAVSFWSVCPTDGQVHYLMQDASFARRSAERTFRRRRARRPRRAGAPGATSEDVEREREAKISAYTQARRRFPPRWRLMQLPTTQVRAYRSTRCDELTVRAAVLEFEEN